MKNNLDFKEINQLNMPYFILHEILQAVLKKGNIHSEFIQIFLKHSTLNVLQLNIFNILCFCISNPFVFHNIFTHRTRTKYALRNENYIQEPLCQIQSALHFIQWTLPLQQNDNLNGSSTAMSIPEFMLIRQDQKGLL